MLSHEKSPVSNVKSSEPFLALLAKDLYHAIFLCVLGSKFEALDMFGFLVVCLVLVCFFSGKVHLSLLLH